MTEDSTDLAVTGELVITKMQPGTTIEANFDALEASISKLLEDYAGVGDLVVTEDYYRTAKKDRAYLNGLKKSIDQRRLDVKKRYMAAYEVFEERVKQLVAPIAEASAAIDKGIKDAEEKEKAHRRGQLVAHFEDYAPILVGVVPFERIEDPKWLNRSVNVMTAFSEIEAIVDKLADDEAALTELDLPNPVEAKTELFATLDLSRAIARSKQLEEQAAATRRFEAEKAEIVKERQAPPAPEPVVEVPVAQADTAPAPLVVEVSSTTTPATYTYTLTVTCTPDDFERLVAAADTLGIHGKAVRT